MAYLYHDVKDAHVTLKVEGFINFIQPTESVDDYNVYSFPVDRLSNGFLIQENYIVTALSNLGLPTLSGFTGPYAGVTAFGSTTNYAPVPPTTNPLPFDDGLPVETNNCFNFFNLKVRVNGVNDSDCTYVYTPRVVGIDAVRNLAVLRIDDLDVQNQGIPPLTAAQDYLEWGNSQDLCVGQDVYILTLGGNTGIDSYAVPALFDASIGRPLGVGDDRPKIEHIIVVPPFMLNNIIGAPVIDKKGRVVGISVDNSVYGYVSQHQAQYIIDALITGIHGPLGCHLTQTTSTNLGYPINVFVQPILGFRYDSFNGNNLQIKPTLTGDDDEFGNFERYAPSPALFTSGTLCNICYCKDSYCLGSAKKHILPIQITYKAVVGDQVLLCGVNAQGVPFETVATFQAPAGGLFFIPNALSDIVIYIDFLGSFEGITIPTDVYNLLSILVIEAYTAANYGNSFI